MFIPTKEFMGLGSLSKLTTLRISNSFLPDIDFTEADARIMFSGLGALENLTIKLRAQKRLPSVSQTHFASHIAVLSQT